MFKSEAQAWVDVLQKLSDDPHWEVQQQAYGAYEWTPRSEAWAVVRFDNCHIEVVALFKNPNNLIDYLNSQLNKGGRWIHDKPYLTPKFVGKVEPMSEK